MYFEENTEKQGRKIRLNYECGIGKRENCFEFVPCLCNMDERNSGRVNEKSNPSAL